MTETTSTTTPTETDPTPIAIAAAKDKGASFYMLLWAPLPDPSDHPALEEARRLPLPWRELGWVQAHDPEQAKGAAMTVVRTTRVEDLPTVDPREAASWAPHPEREPVEIALGTHGLKLRAIARRGWVDESSIEPTRLVNNPQLVIG